MKNRQTAQNEMINNAIKVTKRIAITIIICIPFLLVFAYLTAEVIKGVWQVLCFVAIMSVAVLVEEIVARRIEKRKQAKEFIEGKKDVFKS